MIMTYELRQCAMQCADATLRQQMKDCADNLGVALKLFAISASEDNLQIVNGLWALGQRLIDRYDMGGPTDGKGGAMKAPIEFELPDEDNLMREAA